MKRLRIAGTPYHKGLLMTLSPVLLGCIEVCSKTLWEKAYNEVMKVLSS